MKTRTQLQVAVMAFGVVLADRAPTQAQTTDPISSRATEATPPGRPPQAYGAGVTIYAFAASAMSPLHSDTTYSVDASFNRFRTGGSPDFGAPVIIPTGGLVTFLELDACDTNVAGLAFADLYRCPTGGAGCVAMASVLSGQAATPGCTQFVSSTITSPAIDNDNFHYQIQVGLNAIGATTALRAVRVGWRRQVSPAPGGATFSDVPVGHPFHRFVEALVASGVTGGCGAGNYCPDAALTRGQMAVFLATALGLHWPN
jgi:hypothetical protein